MTATRAPCRAPPEPRGIRVTSHRFRGLEAQIHALNCQAERTEGKHLMTEPPFVTLSRGYAASSRAPRKSLLPFAPDECIEQLITDVAEGKVTPTPELRMQIGYYQRAKAAHLASGKGGQA